ncbi:hypothetical protein QTH97_07915 [Variovorax sp. J22R24]|uniref:hypothetical protein n=1 Tax=Variovorax gracilis TaxID=3053502 RepID=UPI002577DFE1|nr:hypothetical protein [Variovorax sp. J22R24]MDM0104855.1 hypothetical protein [Variovorax sp. J22R24]
MFMGKTVSLEFHDGWLPTFAETCEQIDKLLGENKREFRWVQVKEKFGSARFYFRLGKSKRVVIDVIDPQEKEGHALIKNATRIGDAVASRIDAIVDEAEAKTQMICMLCGADAQTRPFDGYYWTLCAAHAPPVKPINRPGEP